MSVEFNAGFPSTRQIQNMIRDKKTVEVKLVTGDYIAGRLLWQDPHCICLETDDHSKLQIWHQAIVFLKSA